MTVYVDRLRSYPHKRKQYAHMVADTLEELHEFAESIGVKRHWFHNGDHYDIREEFWHLAVARGVSIVTTREIVALKIK